MEGVQRRYLEWLEEGIAWEEVEKAGLVEIEGENLQVACTALGAGEPAVLLRNGDFSKPGKKSDGGVFRRSGFFTSASKL